MFVRASTSPPLSWIGLGGGQPCRNKVLSDRDLACLFRSFDTDESQCWPTESGWLGYSLPRDQKGFALTPNSPEVKDAVEKAAYTSSPTPRPMTTGSAPGPGGLHPVDSRGRPVAYQGRLRRGRLQAAMGNLDPAKLDAGKWDIYSTGLSIIFLIKLDTKKYHSDIECLLASLRTRQKPHGGWGYPEKDNWRHLDDPVRRARFLDGQRGRIQCPVGIDRVGGRMAHEDARPRRRVRLSGDDRRR